MRAYKGFDKDLRCRGFQYEVGKEYETDAAKVCETGFHSCLYPLDVLNYYPPNTSRYCEVDVSGKNSRAKDDSKVATTKIKIGAEIGIAGIVRAAIEYTKERATEVEGGHATGNRGAASATGYRGAASATGYLGAASATGNLGAASATGDQGAASATGKACVALAAGIESRAMGEIGNAICIVERGEYNGMTYPIKAIKAAIVDGETIKPGVWYTLEDGEFVEVEAE